MYLVGVIMFIIRLLLCLLFYYDDYLKEGSMCVDLFVVIGW